MNDHTDSNGHTSTTTPSAAPPTSESAVVAQYNKMAVGMVAKACCGGDCTHSERSAQISEKSVWEKAMIGMADDFHTKATTLNNTIEARIGRLGEVDRGTLQKRLNEAMWGLDDCLMLLAGGEPQCPDCGAVLQYEEARTDGDPSQPRTKRIAAVYACECGYEQQPEEPEPFCEMTGPME